MGDSCFTILGLSQEQKDDIRSKLEFANISDRELSAVISAWKDSRNSQHSDEIPTGDELADFVRSQHLNDAVSESLDNIDNLEEAMSKDLTTKQIKYRAFRIARLFSEVVNELVKKELQCKKPNTMSSLQMRRYIIKDKYGISKILGNVKYYIQQRYANKAWVTQKLMSIYSIESIENLSIEDRNVITNEIEWQLQQGELMLKHFDALLVHANPEIKNLESISVITNESDISVATEYNFDDKEERSRSDIEYYKKAHEESAEETLDREIWSMVNDIYDLDENGILRDPESSTNTDDLDDARPLSPKQVSATLFDICSKIIECEEMIPTLMSKVKDFPWIQQIVDMLCGKDSFGHTTYEGLTPEQKARKTLALQAKFWNGFHKIHVNMGVQQVGKSGAIESIIVNSTEGVDAALRSYEEAVVNHTTQYYTDQKGEIHSFATIYGPNGEFKESVFNEISKMFGRFSTPEYQEMYQKSQKHQPLNKREIFNLIKALKAFGITTSVDKLKDFFTVDESIPEESKEVKYQEIQNLVNIIARTYNTSSLNSALASAKVAINNINIKGLFDIFNVQYRRIANILGKYHMGYEESVAKYSVDGEYKKMYSHIYSNCIHKIIYKLNNIDNKSEEKYLARIKKDFLSNWFFSKDGIKSLNTWIRDLIQYPEIRRAFQLKSLKSSNAISYSKEIDVQAELTRLNEFEVTSQNITVKAPPEKDKKAIKDIHMCYYSVPTFSDTDESYFIKGRKYEHSELSQCVEDLSNVLEQEIDRMRVVWNRGQYMKTHPKAHPIATYDIQYNSDGSIKKYGGYQFFFFPSLNAKRNEILSTLQRLKSEAEKKQYLISLVKEAMSTEYDFYCSKVNQWGIHTLKGSKFNVDDKYREGIVESITNPLKPYLSIMPNAGTLKQFTDALQKNILSENQYKGIIGNIQSLLLNVVNQKQGSQDATILEMINAINNTLNTLELLKNDYNDTLNNRLQTYFMNSYLANAQIIQLTMGDPAFLGAPTKFQKRFKMFYSPIATCYTSHYMYNKNGNIQLVDGYTKDTETYLVLKDSDIQSTSLSDIEQFIREQEKRGMVSKTDAKDILDSLKSIISSDAQCYRGISSWEMCLNMIGQGDNQAAHETIEHMKQGTFNEKDFWVMWQIFKPFVCSYSYVESHLNEGSQYQYIKTPIQHKNSEFLLLALYGQLNGVMKNHEKLVALNDFMETHGIDKVQFETAVKTGCQAPIDLNLEVKQAYISQDIVSSDPEGKNPVQTKEGVIYQDFRTNNAYIVVNGKPVMTSIRQQVQHILEETTGLTEETKAVDENGNFNGNLDVVHSYPMKDWGISTSMPEHLLEHDKSSLGTQLMKVILENIDPNEPITFSKVPMADEDGNITYHSYTLTGKQWIDLYQAVFTQNLVDDFQDVETTIKTPKELSKYLKKQIFTQNKLPIDLLKRLKINENTGDFEKPLIDPMLRNYIDPFLSSMIRNKVRKQGFKMGALPQVASWGIDNDLSMRFQDSEGVLIFNEKEWNNPNTVLSKIDREQLNTIKVIYHGSYVEYRKHIDSVGKVIRGVEVYVPIYDMQIIEPFVDSNGRLDESAMLEKLDPSLLEFIGYRLPTESEHSIAPMIIKGFLPYQNCSCVMIAPEWVAMSDFDNDGDKLYSLFYEMTVKVDKNNVVDSFLQTADGVALKDALRNEKFAHAFTNLMFDMDYYKVYKIKVAANKLVTYIAGNKEFPQNQGFINKSLKTLNEFYPKFRQYINEQKKNPDKIVQIIQVPFRLDERTKNLADFDRLMAAIKQNSRASRNNLVLDMMKGAMQTATKSQLAITPGGFSEAKRTFKLIQILENSKNNISDKQYELISQPTTTKGSEGLGCLSTQLEDCSICNPAIRTIQQTRNMVSARLIAIYANYRSAWSYIQLAPKLIVNEQNRITLNGNKSLPTDFEGKPTWRFNEMRNNLGEYISNNIYQFLGSSVENAKESLLSFLGQTNSTAAISMALICTGYTVMDVALFMNQPVIKNIVREQAIRGGYLGAIAKYKLQSLKSEYYNMVNSTGLTVSKEMFNEISNLDGIILAKQIHRNAQQISMDVYDYAVQIQVLDSLIKFLPVSTMLNNIIQVTKANTYNGSAKSSSADNQNLIMNIKLSANQAHSKNSPIIGAEVFFELAEVKATERPTLDQIFQSKIPMLTAFEYCCLQAVENLYRGISLTFNDFVMACHEAVLDSSKHSAKQIETVTNAVATYLFSGIEEFNPEGITFAEREFAFSRLLNILIYIKNRKLIDGNMLLDDLIVNKHGNFQTLGMGYISLKRSSRNNPMLRDSYVSAWTDLYRKGNRTIIIPVSVINPMDTSQSTTQITYKELANYLFKYCFFANGLSSAGLYTIIRMYPSSEIDNIDGYNELLNKLNSLDFRYNDLTIFAKQFSANNPTMVSKLINIDIFTNILDKIYKHNQYGFGSSMPLGDIYYRNYGQYIPAQIPEKIILEAMHIITAAEDPQPDTSHINYVEICKLIKNTLMGQHNFVNVPHKYILITFGERNKIRVLYKGSQVNNKFVYERMNVLGESEHASMSEYLQNANPIMESVNELASIIPINNVLSFADPSIDRVIPFK